MPQMPEWKIKRFNELSADEIYQCLALRSEVFIVEQKCVYNDVDDKDQKAMHIYGQFNDEIVGYARIFKPGDYFEKASIGRVVIKAEYRDRKWGHDLIKKAIDAVSANYGETIIVISAQLYLKKFYESHGFCAVGDSYLEDDIPHIKMQLN